MCWRLKMGSPHTVDPETPARGERSSILQTVQAINFGVEVDEFEVQRSRDPCLKQPTNDFLQVGHPSFLEEFFFMHFK